jgi:hypothetical protein
MYICKKKEMDSKIFEKGLFTGILEQDEKGNFFCGEFLLDFKMASAGFAIGDLITIKSVIVNPSDLTYNTYPKKSKNFAKANLKE